MKKDFAKMNNVITQYCNIGYDECQYICELYKNDKDSYYQDARKISEELDRDLIVVLLVLIRYKSIENDISFKKNHPDDVELHNAYDFALDMQSQKPYSGSITKAENKRKKESEEKTMKKLMGAEERNKLMPDIYKRYMSGELPVDIAKDFNRSGGWVSLNLNEWVYNNITDEKEIEAFEAKKKENYDNRGKNKKKSVAAEQPKDDTVISLEEVRTKEESVEEDHKNKLDNFYKAWMYNARQIESMAYEEGMSSAALKEELYKYGETVELTPDQINDMLFYRENINKKATYAEWLEMYKKVKAGEVGVYDAIDQLHMSMKDYRDQADAYERGELLDAMLAADTDVTESKTADIINIHVDNCWNNLYNLRPLLEVNLVNDSLAAKTLAVFSTRSKPNDNDKCYKEACDFIDKYVCSYDDNGNCIVNKELCVDAYDKDSLYMTELINACFSRKVVVVLCVHDHNGRILYNERFPRDNAKDLFNVFGNATRVDAVDMTLDDVYAADELYEVVMSINNGTDDTYIWKVLFADQESALKYQKDTYFNTLEGEVSETSYAHKCKMVDGKLTEIGGSLGGWFSNFAS